MVSAGRVLLLPKGNYSATTTYDMLDLVAYNGITWLCKRQCIGITPSDSESLYWQKFGSAAPIASTTVPGLVMPDGNTITINTSTGAIAVPIALTTAPGLVQPDGTTISISAQGVISCSISDLEDLGDVVFSQLANGQTLVYNASNQTWQNGNVASALSALSDVVLTNPSAGDILLYDNGTSKWINAKASANLSLSDTKPVQNATVTKALTDVVETVGSGASRSYSAGDIIVATSGTMYKATTDIAQNTTLTVGGNIEATSQRALNTNLTQSLGGVEFRIDTVNSKPQVSIDGGQTFVNFSGGGDIESVINARGTLFISKSAGDIAWTGGSTSGRSFTRTNNTEALAGFGRFATWQNLPTFGGFMIFKTEEDANAITYTWAPTKTQMTLPSGNTAWRLDLGSGCYPISGSSAASSGVYINGENHAYQADNAKTWDIADTALNTLLLAIVDAFFYG